MSRSGYSDDCEYLAVWRGQVASAIRGKRGQAFLRDLLKALDAMPVKELVAGDLEDESGCVCALGALGRHRGIDLETLDTYDYVGLGSTFNIARQLAQEVMYENDEGFWRRGDAGARWKHMRDWVAKQIIVTPEECNAIEILGQETAAVVDKPGAGQS